MGCDQSQLANYFKTWEIKIHIKPESAEKFPYVG